MGRDNTLSVPDLLRVALPLATHPTSKAFSRIHALRILFQSSVWEISTILRIKGTRLSER